ncbi:hypothetical protein O181_020809 [Austropuccinia psidii MF-1]|uniref:Uncharacterized protein n=1 Tax=Austropuccinia psidii MF-1 TaxID=1389203 RepID=A0A9Q3C9L5_9BASI|nr:hypothetical protein [Austropuccinia psidii MF-1]
MSLKAQTHFNTICNFWVISPHWLPPPRCVAYLCARTAPHLCPHHSLCFHTPTLTILTCSQHAPDTAYHPYACRAPSRHAPDTTYPYACVVPSRHASNTANHPYACRVPSQHCLPSLCLWSALPTPLMILTLV